MKRQLPLRKRASKLTLSVLAVLITLLPLLSAAWWVRSAYFADPRDTMKLQKIVSPSAPVRPFDEPLVSVTFDDGWESVYSKGAKIFEKYQIPTTQYVLSGTFTYHNYLSKGQIVSLQNAGHDIQSHTVTHADLTTLDDHHLLKELKQSHDDISKLLGKETKDFASPLNRYDSGVIDEIKKYYRSHRTTDADVISNVDTSYNSRGTFDPYHITAFSVRRTTTLEQIKNFLAAAKASNGWAILIYHEIDDESQDYYAVTPKQLEEQFSAIKASGIRVATMSDVLNVYYATPSLQVTKKETDL